MVVVVDPHTALDDLVVLLHRLLVGESQAHGSDCSALGDPLLVRHVDRECDGGAGRPPAAGEGAREVDEPRSDARTSAGETAGSSSSGSFRQEAGGGAEEQRRRGADGAPTVPLPGEVAGEGGGLRCEAAGVGARVGAGPGSSAADMLLECAARAGRWAGARRRLLGCSALGMDSNTRLR